MANPVYTPSFSDNSGDTLNSYATLKFHVTKRKGRLYFFAQDAEFSAFVALHIICQVIWSQFFFHAL